MTGKLDAFRLRPGIDGLLARLQRQDLLLGALGTPWERLERAGIAHFFARSRDTRLPPASS